MISMPGMCQMPGMLTVHYGGVLKCPGNFT